MEVSERFSAHAEWCEKMAAEYRRDAESVNESQRRKWLEAAERLEDDARFYLQHARFYQ